jgi:hypothetical protein
LIRNKQGRGFWEELPSVDSDLEVDCSQRELLEYIEEVALCHIQNQEIPSWNSFFGIESSEENQPVAA